MSSDFGMFGMSGYKDAYADFNPSNFGGLNSSSLYSSSAPKHTISSAQSGFSFLSQGLASEAGKDILGSVISSISGQSTAQAAQAAAGGIISSTVQDVAIVAGQDAFAKAVTKALADGATQAVANEAGMLAAKTAGDVALDSAGNLASLGSGFASIAGIAGSVASGIAGGGYASTEGLFTQIGFAIDPLWGTAIGFAIDVVGSATWGKEAKGEAADSAEKDAQRYWYGAAQELQQMKKTRTQNEAGLVARQGASGYDLSSRSAMAYRAEYDKTANEAITRNWNQAAQTYVQTKRNY